MTQLFLLKIKLNVTVTPRTYSIIPDVTETHTNVVLIYVMYSAQNMNVDCRHNTAYIRRTPFQIVKI
jgi:hypothetical protein